ncbi:MAG: hypothetical protein ACLP2Y_09405 [Limisphaerales bacterium]
MSFRQKLRQEIKALALATLYFATWIAVLVVIKKLILAEYGIPFHGLLLVLVGTLILAKIVLVLEHVPLGAWLRARPVWVEVILRPALYFLGVFVLLVLERAFEGRHEHGGFGPSLVALFQNAEMNHVWINTIWISGALLGYNTLSVVRRHLGEGGLLRLFLSPHPETSPLKPAEASAPIQAKEKDRA